MKRRITVLGTGRMGSALVLGFLARGHAVTVWNRTSSKAEPLGARGARIAATVEDAIAGSEIVVGNVSDYATSAALVAPAAATAALRSKLYVQLATGTPGQAREAAAWAAAHDIPYLDGAIMATPNFIGQPGCTILYSGSAELFSANRDAFAALGGNAVHVGADIGHANALDAALLIVLWGALLGTFQAAALCEAEGFPLPTFSSTLEATMPVIGGALKDAVARIADRRFAADATTMASVEICYASARLIHEMSERHGIDLGLPQALDRLFSRASAAGHAQADIAAVYQAMKA